MIKRLIYIFIILSIPINSWAICAGPPLNPITDIAWHGIFPIKIGGVPIGQIDLPDPGDPANAPICACPAPPPIFIRIGIPISYWEPSRFIETVKDPYCFPSLGFSVLPNAAVLSGGTSEGQAKNSPSTFAQAHYFIYAPFQLLGMMLDFICVEHTDFDLAYMTEVDPLWNDDLLSAMISPESLLFANPIAQLACMADAATSNLGLPIKYLFWCMGSWGSAYPLTGHKQSDSYTEANGAIAARMIYKLSRQLMIHDTALNLCFKTPTPIWIKNHYRLQAAKPIRGLQVFPVGRTGVLWSPGVNAPVTNGDNFLFMLFRKRACCAF